MARLVPAKKTEVDNITHEEAKRANIPTSEMKPLVEATQKKQVNVEYEKRNPDLDPQLIWRGKYDGDATLAVKAPPLYIQEKIHPKALIEELRRAGESDPGMAEELARYQFNLFGEFNGIPKGVDKTDFYQHEQNWTNRMILGDSLQVMASLAEREGLRGQVQAIYLDPPYGIKFNSNFQWSTNSRDVKDGKVEQLTREPEQVKAFRDTWEDGIHSYLSYLRDRFIVARDLLTESGSIFVQIGDENVHRVRAVLDEVFGEDNYVNTIVIKKKGNTLITESMFDFILWYAKSKDTLKVNNILKIRKTAEEDDKLNALIAPNNEIVRLSSMDNARAKEMIKKGWRYARLDYSVVSQDVSQTRSGEYIYHGQRKKCPVNGHWRYDPVNGFRRLERADRLFSGKGESLSGIVFHDDWPAGKVGNLWEDVKGEANPVYVVQTAWKIIQRCLLMATDPGDLVLDPTCGSGTTAYVAEQWGRRWITIDTSRVALALARARLMGARYPWYLMADSAAGAAKEASLGNAAPYSGPFGENIRLGFVYERVPHITLKAIANNAEIDTIWEKWQPGLEELRRKLNVSLNQNWEEWEIPREAAPDWPAPAKKLHNRWWEKRLDRQKEIDASIAARADYEYLYDKPYEDSKRVRVAGPFTVESISPYRVLSVDENDDLLDPGREPEQAEGRDFSAMIIENLRKAGVQQAQKANRIQFTSIEPFAAGNLICAEGRYQEGETEKRAAIFIGPEFGTVSREDLVEAAREAGEEQFDILIACAFNFEANTEELKKRGIMPILKARMNAELHMTEALRKTDKGNLFVVFGEPDIEIIDQDKDEIMVRINGVDVYNPARGEIVSDNASDIACWMIDTNYNEESFLVRQVYFLGQKNPYDSLRRALNADIDKEAWESLNSRQSRPFKKPDSGRIAVKVINHLGDEVMKVFKV